MLLKEYIPKIDMISELHSIATDRVYDMIDNYIKDNSDHIIAISYIADNYYVITQKNDIFVCHKYEWNCGNLVRGILDISSTPDKLQSTIIKDAIIHHQLYSVTIISDEARRDMICRDIKDGLPNISVKSIQNSLVNVTEVKTKKKA